MILNIYRITPRDEALRDALIKQDGKAHIDIAAPSRKSAWGKFTYRYFGVFKPRRADYTIRLGARIKR